MIEGEVFDSKYNLMWQYKVWWDGSIENLKIRLKTTSKLEERWSYYDTFYLYYHYRLDNMAITYKSVYGIDQEDGSCNRYCDDDRTKYDYLSKQALDVFIDTMAIDEIKQEVYLEYIQNSVNAIKSEIAEIKSEQEQSNKEYENQIAETEREQQKLEGILGNLIATSKVAEENE